MANFLPALAFPSLTPLYDPLIRLTMPEEAFKNRVLDLAGVAEGTSVLEVGCGTGTLAIMAARRGARVTAVDADETILAIAKKKATGLDIHFVHGLAQEADLPPASFDAAVSSLFFHHLSTENKLTVLRTLATSLRPGAKLCVADWGKPQDTAMAALIGAVRLLDGPTVDDNREGRLPALVAEAGFREVTVVAEQRTLFGTLAFVVGTA